MAIECPSCGARLSDDGKTLEAKGERVATLEAELAAYRSKLPELRQEIARLKTAGEKPKRGRPRRSVSNDEPKKTEARKPEPPAGLSPYARRRWLDEHDS